MVRNVFIFVFSTLLTVEILRSALSISQQTREVEPMWFNVCQRHRRRAIIKKPLVQRLVFVRMLTVGC